MNPLKQIYTHHLAKYERYFGLVFFLGGFLFDVFTLGEIDDVTSIVLQACYLFICTGLMFVELLGISQEEIKSEIIRKLFVYKEEAFHFFLGALLSSYMLLFFKSSSFLNSFIFLLVICTVLIGNELELVKKHGIIVRSVMLKICVVSFWICLIPTIIGISNWIIFVLSLLFSFLCSYGLFNYLKNKFIYKEYELKKRVLYPHLIVLGFFLIFYLLKVFPPIPLSLKHIGVYREVIKKEGKYITSQTTPTWKFWSNGDQNFYYRPEDRIYIFIRLYSPGRFSGNVNFHWQKKIQSNYRTSDKISFKVSGGSIEGFRGFSYKKSITPGEWRVLVQTMDGLEIGRINFEVIADNSFDERLLIHQEF